MSLSSRPSIRLRRFPSAEPPPRPSSGQSGRNVTQAGSSTEQTTRRRSASDPTRHHLNPNVGHQQPAVLHHLPDISEQNHVPEVRDFAATQVPAENQLEISPELRKPDSINRKPAPTTRLPSFIRRKPLPDLPPGQDPSLARLTTIASGVDEYHSNLVDYLDLIDPEVSTLNTLNNVQNSLFVPDLGRFLNRRPTYTLTKRPSEMQTSLLEPEKVAEPPVAPTLSRGDSLATINSTMSESRYAVLPHGISLEGWSDEDKKELNDHVRHFLHSKRSRFKRSLKGFAQYIKKPLGFFVTLYAFLITVFGLIWVLFLIGWINVGGKKFYVINVIDNVLVALFAIMGDGLAPFRAVDTYHMCFIAHYHHLTWRLRKEKALPQLQDHNDLPAQLPDDVELGTHTSKMEVTVLTRKQQQRLIHHQTKFSNSHTFYKPHETSTHYAFPLRLLVAIVCLLDAHSFLQISLGACTWGISYHKRPFALTTVILCCSITVNILAGVLITVGDHKTRKKDVLEKMHRQDLTAEAIQKLEKKRKKNVEGEENF